MSSRAKKGDLSRRNGANGATDHSGKRDKALAVYEKGPGYVRMIRSPATDELLRDPLAFALLAQIVIRARWKSPFDLDDLELWEARIGDHDNCGMTRQQYRTRLRRLEKCGLITTRTTNKGTIAKLVSTDVFDLRLPSEQAESRPPKQPAALPLKTAGQQPPTQPTANHQLTTQQPLTKNEIMKERNIDDDEAAPNSSGFATPEEAKRHPLWPKFANWCRSKNGRPTVAGFNTWLRSQPSLPEKKAPRTDSSNYQRLVEESRARADAER